MPANAPDYIEDERERQLYRELSRVYENFCGDDPKLFDERRAQFVRINELVNSTLRRAPSESED